MSGAVRESGLSLDEAEPRSEVATMATTPTTLIILPPLDKLHALIESYIVKLLTVSPSCLPSNDESMRGVVIVPYFQAFLRWGIIERSWGGRFV